MPLSDIILNGGQVLLTQVDPSEINVTLGDSSLQTAQLALVSQISDRYTIGQYVLYDPTDSTPITFNGVSYVLVDEDKIFFTAPYVPPS